MEVTIPSAYLNKINLILFYAQTRLIQAYLYKDKVNPGLPVHCVQYMGKDNPRLPVYGYG
jgi:hypothetical protein